METKPQVDSPQKSPVSKTLPPSEKKDEAAKQPLQDLGAPCASTSVPTSGSTASSASQEVKEKDSKAESKPEAVPSSTEAKHHVPEGSNEETDLHHPIISVDIKKSAPSEIKKEVPQETKTNTAEVPPEVLASVVTTAVVNEAASAVGDTDSGLATSGTKVTSDPSKVDSVVEQELNKLSEKIKEEIQLKSKDGVQSDTKPLPNGDIDHSPVKSAADSEKGLKEEANTESESNAQTIEDKEDSSMHPKGSKTEACKNNEAVAQNQNNILDQIQNSEITSSNGVPGIITVVGITKKDSTQIKEASESTTKVDNASGTKKEPDDATKEENSKDEGFEKIGSSYKYDDKRELASVSSSEVDCEAKNKVGENIAGGNLTDSAKIQSSIQKVYEDIDGSKKKKEILDSENPIQNEDSQFKKCESPKTKPTSENESEKSASQIDSDKDEDTQEKSAKDAKENIEDLAKSGNESIPDKTTTQELKTSTEPEEPKEKDVKSETDSSKKELTSEDKISSDTSKQTESPVIFKSGVTSATSDSSTTIAAPELVEGTEELCDMSMMASMTTSQILTEEMLNGSSMEQDKNKKNLSLDSEASSKDDQHKIEVRSMASATSGTCDIGVGSDERTVIRCASGDGGEEEVDGEPATTEIEITEEANAGTLSPDRQSSESPSASSDAAASEISQEKPGDAEDKPASAASRTSSIPEATVYEPPERRRSAASSAANEDKRDGDAGDKSKDESEKLEEEDGDKDSQATSQRDTPVDNNKEEAEPDVSSEEKVDEGKVLEDHAEATEDEVATDENQEKVENNETAEEKEKGAEEDDEKATERPESNAEQDKADGEDAQTSQSASGEKDEIKEDADESAEKDVVEDVGDTKDGDGVIESEEAVDKVDDEPTEEENVEKTDAEKVDGEKEDSGVEVDDGEKGAKEDEMPKELEEPKTLVEEEKEVQEEASEIKDEKDANASSEKNEETEEVKNEEEKAEISEEKEEEKPEIETDHDADAVKDEGEEQPKNEEPPPETEEAKEEQSATKEVENAEPTPETAGGEAADNEAEKEADDKQVAEGDEAGQTEKQPEAEEAGKEEPQSPTKRGRSPDKASRRGVSPISSPPKSLKTPPSPQKPQKATSPKKKNGALSPIKTPKTPASDTRKLPPIKAPVGLAPNPNLKNIRSKIGSFDNIKYKPGGGDKKVISTKKLEWKAAPKIGSLDHSFKGEKKRSRSKDGKDGKGADGQSGDEAEPEVTSAETLIKPEGAADMPVAIAAES